MRKSKQEIEDLLLRMSFKESDQLDAEKAFNDLFYSYREFLYNIVRHSLKKKGIEDTQFFMDIVNRTLLKVYHNPLEFEFPKDSINDGKFVAWLSVLAKFEGISLQRSQLKNRNVELELEESLEPAFDDVEYEESESMNKKSQQLDEILDSLGEKNKRIFLHTFDFEQKGRYKNAQDLDIICEMHQTTRDNIRQIKRRGIKLIKEKLGIESISN